MATDNTASQPSAPEPEKNAPQTPEATARRRITPEALRERAIALHRQGKVGEAATGYQAYLMVRPEDAGIWCNLGAAYRQQKHHQLAINSYHRALHLQPDDAGMLSNLGNVLKDVDRFDEAIDAHRRALALDDDNARYRFNYAVSLREAGRFEEAVEQLDTLLAQEPDNPWYQWDKALALLPLNRYREAWPYYEARWRTGELPERRETCPRWQGEPFTDQRLLVHAEQGFGDTLMAARFLPWVKERGGHVTLECKPELHRLFQQLPVDELVTPEEQARRTKENPAAFDYRVPMMSLMGVFDVTPETVPPPMALHVPDEARKKFAFLKQQHADKRKIGIVWSGSLTFKGNDKRAQPLEAFLPLAEDPTVQLYSLQKGPKEKDLQTTRAQPLVINLAPLLSDFADTAAAIEYLDAIDMTDSSVFHLAGALGAPVTCRVRQQIYWPYYSLARWYPDKASLEKSLHDSRLESRSV